jgi:hypothetical protein
MCLLRCSYCGSSTWPEADEFPYPRPRRERWETFRYFIPEKCPDLMVRKIQQNGRSDDGRDNGNGGLGWMGEGRDVGDGPEENDPSRSEQSKELAYGLCGLYRGGFGKIASRYRAAPLFHCLRVATTSYSGRDLRRSGFRASAATLPVSPDRWDWG